MPAATRCLVQSWQGKVVENTGDTRVIIDPELSLADVRDVTERSLEAGAELSDFEIPWIAIAVEGAVALKALLQNETNLEGAVKTLLSNTGARILCGKLGEVSGSVLGGLLFGPAGVIVWGAVGAVGGSVVGKSAARARRRLLLVGEEEALRTACVTLAGEAAATVPSTLAAWEAKAERIEDEFRGAAGQRKDVGNHLLGRMDDDQRYLRNKQVELERWQAHSASRDAMEEAQRLLILIRRAALDPYTSPSRCWPCLPQCRT